MKTSWIMDCQTNAVMSSDQVGGLPSHLPVRPVRDSTGDELAFIAQFYAHPEHLPLASRVLCLNLYQRFPVDNPEPTLVALPLGSPLRNNEVVKANPEIKPSAISWRTMREPDALPEEWSDVHERTLISKANGLTIHNGAIPKGGTFVLQMTERLVPGLNFGGYTLVVFVDKWGVYGVTLD